MGWDAIFALVTAGATLVGVNLAMLQWMLDRRARKDDIAAGRVEEIAGALTNLRVSLPLEYVRREDWIRFGATLDAKLDRMREETREELAAIKERLV